MGIFSNKVLVLSDGSVWSSGSTASGISSDIKFTQTKSDDRLLFTTQFHLAYVAEIYRGPLSGSTYVPRLNLKYYGCLPFWVGHVPVGI